MAALKRTLSERKRPGWDPGLSSSMLLHFLCSATAHSFSVNPSVYGCLQGARDASFVGNSWAEICVVGLTQLTSPQVKETGSGGSLSGVGVELIAAGNRFRKRLGFASSLSKEDPEVSEGLAESVFREHRLLGSSVG